MRDVGNKVRKWSTKGGLALGANDRTCLHFLFETGTPFKILIKVFQPNVMLVPCNDLDSAQMVADTGNSQPKMSGQICKCDF
jgi:hypothetical protein